MDRPTDKLDKVLEQYRDRPTLLIAAYPGMGQDALEVKHKDYGFLSTFDYPKEADGWDEGWSRKFAVELIRLVKLGEKKVYFFDPHPDVITHLEDLGQELFIFYPNTNKNSVLGILAVIYCRNASFRNGKALADVALNYETHMQVLKMYYNSVAFSTGLIEPSFLNQLIALNATGRANVLAKIKDMKVKSRLSEKIVSEFDKR